MLLFTEVQPYPTSLFILVKFTPFNPELVLLDHTEDEDIKKGRMEQFVGRAIVRTASPIPH